MGHGLIIEVTYKGHNEVLDQRIREYFEDTGAVEGNSGYCLIDGVRDICFAVPNKWTFGNEDELKDIGQQWELDVRVKDTY